METKGCSSNAANGFAIVWNEDVVQFRSWCNLTFNNGNLIFARCLGIRSNVLKEKKEGQDIASRAVTNFTIEDKYLWFSLASADQVQRVNARRSICPRTSFISRSVYLGALFVRVCIAGLLICVKGTGRFRSGPIRYCVSSIGHTQCVQFQIKESRSTPRPSPPELWMHDRSIGSAHIYSRERKRNRPFSFPSLFVQVSSF